MSCETELWLTDTPALFDASVRRAAELLRAGEVVALPTETVYGLAANALNPAAVERIFAIKDRPSYNPVIVHVGSIAMARQCAGDWPAAADQLASAFWPGPLTLVVPRAAAVPDMVTAGGPTVGLRWPSHPLMQAVIRACGFPLAAPSANPSNRLSPTSAAHVLSSLKGKIRLVVDGGQAQVGIESTVLDLTVHPLAVLRPGMIHEESLSAVLGGVTIARPSPSGAPGGLRSPGQLLRHYAPRAKLLLLRWRDTADLEAQLTRLELSAPHCHVIAHDVVPTGGALGHISVIPHDAAAYARAIYAELHRCDEAGARVIVVERPPDHRAWRAIADRLSRAAQ